MFKNILNDFTNLNLYSSEPKYSHREYSNEYLSIKNKYSEIFERRLNLENNEASIFNEYKRDNDKTKYTINSESVQKEKKELEQKFIIIRENYILKNKERILKNNFLVKDHLISMTLTKNKKIFDNELLFFLKNNLLYNIFLKPGLGSMYAIRETDYSKYIEYFS